MPVSIKQIALRTIDVEAQSILGLVPFINDDFEKAVAAITTCTGRVVISGIGKSAVIAQKIVATFNSTGTPSIFMHAADAIHGDLGIVQQEDIVIIISKSGESPEIKVLVPLIKNFNNILIGMVGNIDSFLANQSTIILNTDGDLRRMLNNTIQIDNVKAADIMTKNPKSIGPDELAVEALNMLRKNEITQLVVTDNGLYLGVIHLHDLLKEGFI